MEGLNEALGEVNTAWRIAQATHKPDELSKAERGIRQRMKLAVVHEGDPDRELAELARIRKAQRIARRRKGR